MDKSIDGQGPANRFMIPIMMGIAIAVLKMTFSGVQYAYLMDNYKGSVIISAVSFVVCSGLLLFSGFMQQRKFGRTLTIREAFQAMFIAILIIVVTNFIFDQLYMKFDPGMIDRKYKGMIDFAKTRPNSADKLPVFKENYAAEKAYKMSIGDALGLLLQQITQYSIMGLIFALIISKMKPARTA